jgi:quinone-modifying oxidoreductase, subunit QmoC
MAMQSVGLGMLKAKRLNPFEILGGHSVKDKSGFHAMLKKAREIEDKRKKLG